MQRYPVSIVEFENVSYGYASRAQTQDRASETEPGTEGDDCQGARPPDNRNNRPALDNISLSIESGEFVAVIGANGSGKSTLAKHINALLVPQSGRVLTLGFNTADDELSFEIRSHAGMVFQNPDSQMVTSVVADDVAFGPENLAVPYDELVARVDNALDAVKMTPFAQRNPTHLSGGQKQRVCIAGVLAMNPDVLILDEPGAMLDARGRRGIRRIVRELHKSGMTVILITHFMEEAVLAERVFVVSEGRVALAGEPFEVFSQKERLRELALDVPFSLLLAEALQERGVPVSEIVRPAELKEELWRRHGCQGGCQGDVHLDNLPRPADNRADDLRPADNCGGILALERVSYTYSSHEGEVAALCDLTLTVGEGDFLGIIGHTGSGKSTLLQLMSGLLAPSSGRVLLSGTDLNNRRDPQSKRARRSLHTQVGIAFQYPEYQLFARTVAEDIAFAPRNAGLSEEEVDERVRFAMQLLGLDYERFAQLSPFDLSGGEMRRVALAGVLAAKPRILILDEPAAGLDPAGREELLAAIEHYHREGAGIVMVSHSMDDIARLATDILVLKDGAAVLRGNPAEVFSHTDELRALNLGVPQATAFAAELREGGLPLPKDLLTLEALADAVAGTLAGDVVAATGFAAGAGTSAGTAEQEVRHGL
jgi:energy-coupling factor transport system ATP-binding protein